jgi:Flp pilus assembly pilin Flp
MKILNKKAYALLEYAVLFTIIIFAFLIMRSYIQHGISGSWGKAGQSIGFGRQYDPQRTIECGFDEQSNMWYDRNCYAYYVINSQCNGDNACQQKIITSTCLASSCSQLNNGATP